MRRAIPFAALFACALASSALGQEAPPWPTAGRDAAHTGSAPGPPAPYREAWTAEAPAGGPMTEPVVAHDRVVVLGRSGVAALGVEDGEVLWEESRVPGIAGTPAIAGDLVVFAAGEGEDASLVARALEDGRRAWSTDLGAQAFGAPATDGELVVVGTNDGRLLALDAATGEERWEHEAPGSFAGAPAMADGVVVAVAGRSATRLSTVYALDADEGEARWQFSPPVPGLMSAPSIGEGFVVVGTREPLVRAIGLEEGEELWSSPARDLFAPRQIPATPGDVVIADRSHVYRFDAKAGEEAWNFQIADFAPTGAGRFNTLVASSPAVVGDAVLIGDGSGTLSAIDLDGGRRIWRRDLGDGALSAPAAGPEAVYVSVLGEGGAVVALETDPDGRRTNEVSPTVLFPGRAVLNFALAAAVVGGAILLLFGLVLRPRQEAV